MSDSVYDGKVYLRLSVDVSQPNMFAPPLVKQGDSNTRALVITLTDNSEPIAIPDDATVWLNCRNTADNEKRASVECEINADGTVTGIVPTVVMEAAGIIECDVSVITLSESNETELLKSTLFCLSCERAANKDGTTTEAEDSILTGIASGEITIPAAKGDPGPPGPPGPAGSSVTIINAETVPESANWDGEIPTTYAGQTGEKGEIAFWNGELWYLYNVATLGQTTYYHWDKVAVTEDLEAKMDLAPLNPTAEQIAALPAGQVYSDTSNHKGILKTNGQYPYQDGQEFYDSVYIDQHYKQSYDQTGTSVVPILVQIGTSKIGEIGSTLLTHNGTYILFSTGLNPNRILNLEWRKTATYNIPVLSELPTGGRITSIVDGVATIDFYTGDLVEVSGKIYECSVNFPDGMVMPFNYKYEWREVDYYTKTEIDTMIGDIESLLSEV